MSPGTAAPGPTVRLRTKLAAAVVAVVVGFGLCEIAARIIYEAPPDPSREPQLLYQSNPDVGFLHVPNEQGYLDDGFATINALGLRGPLPEMPKPAGTVRVLAIGDSTTFGWGVNDDGTYVAQLDRDLEEAFPGRRISVVNGGVGAYDLRHDARLLQHFGPMLKPDLVIVGVYWNDLPFEAVTPEGESISGGGSEMPGGSSGNAPSKPFRIGNNPSSLNRLLRRSRLLYVLRRAWLAALTPTQAASNTVRWEMALLDGRHSEAIDRAWRDIETTLTEIRDMGQAGGFAVGVLIVPIRAQVEEDHPQAEYQTRVRAMADALGMFVIDPLPAFLAQPPDRKRFFIPYDRIHFTAEGNKVLADAVFDALRGRPEFHEAHPQ
jgi:lysophospholipase L1-like esterase